MRNKKAERLVVTGLILHIIQWLFILWVFLKIKHLFSDYTIYNPNVISGSMQSLSFIQMMRAMIYSGGNRELCIVYCASIAYLLCCASCHLDCSGNGRLRHDQTKPRIFMGILFDGSGSKACHLEYHRHSIFSCRLPADETGKSRKRRHGDRKKAETAHAYPKTRPASKQNPEKIISSG